MLSSNTTCSTICALYLILAGYHSLYLFSCAGSTFLLCLYFSADLILIVQVGLGWSAAMGSGLVVVRGDRGDWSPPSALAMASVGWGLQAGGALHDLLIVLRNRWVLLLIGSIPARLMSGLL